MACARGGVENTKWGQVELCPFLHMSKDSSEDALDLEGTVPLPVLLLGVALLPILSFTQ